VATPRLAALSTSHRALVIAAVLRDGPRAEILLLRGPQGTACAEAARELAAMPSRERATAIVAEAARLFAPVPSGLDEIHPSWLAVSHAAEPPEPPWIARAARHGGPKPPVLSWLRKLLLGHLAAMPTGKPPEPARLELPDLPRLPAPVLERVLEHLGLRALARALTAAGPDAAREVAARLGEPDARALLADVGPGAAQEEGVRALLERVVELAGRARSGRELVLCAGAQRLSPALFGRGDLLLQTAQRLPRPMGLLLLEEWAIRAPVDPMLLDEVRTIVGSSA
jgi:hypothetical protein